MNPVFTLSLIIFFVLLLFCQFYSSTMEGLTNNNSSNSNNNSSNSNNNSKKGSNMQHILSQISDLNGNLQDLSGNVQTLQGQVNGLVQSQQQYASQLTGGSAPQVTGT